MVFLRILRTLRHTRRLLREVGQHLRGGPELDAQRHMELGLQLNPRAWAHHPDFEMPQVPPPGG